MVDLIIKSKVKDVAQGLNVAAEVLPALNAKVEKIMSDAVERAKANGRRTLQARDL